MSITHFLSTHNFSIAWFISSLGKFFLISLLLQLTTPMQLQHLSSPAASNVYNPTQYLQELLAIQNRFSADLAKIQSNFATINSNLNNTNISASAEIIQLQQTLAQ